MNMPNWNRKNLVLIAAGAVTVAAILGVRAYRSAKSPAVETVAPRRGPVTQVVSETGKVIAFEDLTLSFKRSGRVAAILVKEGDEVKKDQPLLRLNTTDLAIQRREAVAALSAAEARYEQAVAGATQEDLRVLETSVQNAEISLETARRSLSDVIASNEATVGKAYADLDGQMETLFLKSSAAMQVLKNDVYDSAGQLRYDISSPDYSTQTQALAAYASAQGSFASMEMSIVTYRASASDADRDSRSAALVADARSVRDAVQLANALMQASVPLGGTTQTSFDARKTEVKAAWADMNLAVNAAESQKLTVGSVAAAATTSVNAATQAVRSAEGALASAQRTLESRSAPLRDVDKAVYLASVSSARANVALIDHQIADATLEAPTDGIVGNIDIDLGEIARADAPVGTLISSGLRIEVEVSELDIAGIRTDQPVVFTFDAIEGRTFAGHVTKVAPRETTKDEDVYYKVDVGIDDVDPAIRIGMTADLDIEVGHKDDVLLVPRRQVYRREGKDYVKVLTAAKKVEEIEVMVGLRGRDDYEIVSGVRESDLIVIE